MAGLPCTTGERGWEKGDRRKGTGERGREKLDWRKETGEKRHRREKGDGRKEKEDRRQLIIFKKFRA